MKSSKSLRITIFPLIILLILSQCQKEKEHFTLVKNGRSDAKIVIADHSGPEIRLAADEFQTYIKKISGVELSIQNETDYKQGKSIFIGRSQVSDRLYSMNEPLKWDGYLIKTLEDDLFIIGNNEHGTLNGVYTFLEKYLGVRWLWPGDLGEVVSKRSTIQLSSIHLVEIPDYIYRDRGPEGALWGAVSGPTEMHSRERLLGINEIHQQEVNAWERRNKWGGVKVYGGHALGEIFPPERYAKTHPEYYAFVNGEREVPGKDYDYKHRGQICTSNPEVVKVAAEWVIDFLNRNPEYYAVHISMNDSRGFCECNKCRALDAGELVLKPGIGAEEIKEKTQANTSITERIFTFANQVSELVQEKHPEKYLMCMAYGLSLMPPKNVEIDPYVIPQYAFWSAYRYSNPVFREHEQLAGKWASISGHTAIYEYHINGSWPSMHRLTAPYFAESIRNLSRLGIDMYQTQSGDDFAINGINYYITGKMLWDTSLNVIDIQEDFYSKAFDSAAGDIERFQKRLEDAWASSTADGNDFDCNTIKGSKLHLLFTPELLQACVDDLDIAEKSTQKEEVIRRIEFFRKGLNYTKLTVEAEKKAKELINIGIPLSSFEDAKKNITPQNLNQVKQKLNDAIAAWEMREEFVEKYKNEYILAYFWIKYNDLNRNFNPSEILQQLRDYLQTV